MLLDIALLEGFGQLRGLGLAEVFSNLHELGIVFPFVFLIIGILYCFFGRKLFDIFNFLIGALLALGLTTAVCPASGFSLLLLVIVSFLIGGLVGFFVPYLLVGIIGFSLGVGLLIGFSPLLALISGIILGSIAVFLFRFFLHVLTALIGGSLAGSAIFEWTGLEEASISIGIILFVTGSIFQYMELDSEVRGRVKED